MNAAERSFRAPSVFVVTLLLTLALTAFAPTAWTGLNAVAQSDTATEPAVPGTIAPEAGDPANDTAGNQPANPSAEIDPMAPLLAYEGQWQIDTTWAGGYPMKGRQTFEPILGGAHLLTRVFITDADGNEYQRYEGTFSWDPKQSTYVYSSLSFDGTATQGTLELNEQGMVFVEDIVGEDGAISQLHQVVGPPEDSGLTWDVWMVGPDGETQMMMENGVWEKMD